jgi:foldase protein PrsA
MKNLSWRWMLYLFVGGYLVLDLKVCHGPLRDAMRSPREAALAVARERGWVALVNREPLTRDQLDLAVKRHLYQRGLDAATVPAKNLDMIRRAVLQSLIDDTLVRQYADGDRYTVAPEETAAFIAAWKSGFATQEDLLKAAAAQGLDEKSLDAELGRIWTRKRWLENRIEPGVTVTEEEAREWYEANRVETGGEPRPGFFEPEKAKIREVVLPVADEAAARQLHAAWKSEVEARWRAREDFPEAVATAVFSSDSAGLLEPIASPHGWHVIEVLEKRAIQPLAFEDLRAEIVAHLEAQRTEETVKDLMEKLRKVANLHIFQENL